MEITLDKADEYFGAENHTMSAVWFAYERQQRMAAIATARRVLERSLHRSLRETQDSGEIRDDYAAFEQALFELRKRPAANANQGQPYPAAQDAVVAEGNQTVSSTFPLLSDDALRWLGWNGVAVIRG